MATFDWQNSPLVVDIGDNMSTQRRNFVRQRFLACRQANVGAAMYIATERDPDSAVWTYLHPTALILTRTVRFASASLHYLRDLIGRGVSGEQVRPFKTVFKTPLDDYDVQIILRADSLSSLPQSIFRRNALCAHGGSCRQASLCDKNDNVNDNGDEEQQQERQQEQKRIILGFEPVTMYLTELRRQFSHVARFFYDPFGGDTIFVAWKPSAFLPPSFNVATAAHTAPITLHCGSERGSKGHAAGVVLPNVVQILADMRLLGDGLVHHVGFVHHQPVASVKKLLQCGHIPKNTNDNNRSSIRNNISSSRSKSNSKSNSKSSSKSKSKSKSKRKRKRPVNTNA